MSHRRRFLLINPNSSATTTEMMVAVAQAAAGEEYVVAGATATRSPPMIVNLGALQAAAGEVVEIALAHQHAYDGLIVSAFGDPGLTEIRSRCAIPATGICEASMMDAAEGGRRFGVATVTPDLVASIDGEARRLGLAATYTGVRLTAGDPFALASDPERLRVALAAAVNRCIRDDNAQAVIIGGGPLGQAAVYLQTMFAVPVIAPIEAAVRCLLAPNQKNDRYGMRTA